MGGGNDLFVWNDGDGSDTAEGGIGNDTILYTNQIHGHDVIVGFDGNLIGGQDVLNLDGLFDSLGVSGKDRASRISIVDKGATVDILVDLDGSHFTDSLLIATLKTSDAIAVGQDVLPGLSV